MEITMSYEISDINGCTKKISFEFESVDLTSEIEKALKEKQKKANLKGFRPGKAPLAMVKKFYGPQIENDALYQFVSKEFFNTIEKEEIQALGYPRFANTKYEAEEKKVAFEATVEVMPTVSIKDFSSYEFKADPIDVKDEEVENLKKQMLESKAVKEEVTDKERALENGLLAIFNFEGEKEDGEKPESMKGNDFELEIGSGQFIPGFEDQMIGLKIGEKKSLPLTFPENYHAEDLRNAKVTFHVELTGIKEKKLPELTDELVKEYGYESVEEFQTKSLENLQNQKKRSSEEKLHQEILDKLIEENHFDIPTTMLAQQRVAVENELSQNLKAQGFTDDMVKGYFSKWSDDLNKRAEFQVRSGLILNELALKYKVESTEEDFDQKLQDVAKMGKLTEDQVDEFYRNNEKVKKNIMYAIREEKTFDKIKAEMKIS